MLVKLSVFAISNPFFPLNNETKLLIALILKSLKKLNWHLREEISLRRWLVLEFEKNFCEKFVLKIKMFKTSITISTLQLQLGWSYCTSFKNEVYLSNKDPIKLFTKLACKPRLPTFSLQALSFKVQLNIQNSY